MAATVNVSDKAFSTTAGSTLESASVTIGGSNRVLYVLAVGVAGTPQACTGVKWGGSGGTALAQLDSGYQVGDWMHVSLWRLIAPTAQASTVYATFAGSNDERFLFIVSVADADQTTPNNTVATAGGTGASPTVNATSVSGDLVLDFLGLLTHAGVAATLTEGGGQTLLQKYDASAINQYNQGGTSSESATGTSTTMSWSSSQGGVTTAWRIFALAVNAAAGGSQALAGDAAAGAQASASLEGQVALEGAATGGAAASAALTVESRRFEFVLYNVDGATPLANKTGLWWAWWDVLADVRSTAPDASGTGASTDASGVFSVVAPSALTPGDNQGFGIISDQDATPDATEAAYVGSFDVV